MTNDNTFVRITNQDIYKKLEEVCEHVKVTNGKVKLNSFISKLAMSTAILGLSIITGINLL